MTNATFFVAQLPEPVVRTKSLIPNDELLNGVLFVLKTCCGETFQPPPACMTTAHVGDGLDTGLYLAA